jgi:alkaline phosphatase D
MKNSFREDPVDDLLAIGAVDQDSARIWVRSATPGRHVLEVAEAGDAARRRVPFDVPADPAADNLAVVTANGLAPGRAHTVSVERPADEVLPARSIGAGRFRTAPDTAGERVAIGVMSCHQPFDEQGRFDPDARAMLAGADQLLRERDAAFVLMLGDQMYSDAPDGCSLYDDDHFATVAPPGRRRLLDCDANEVRRLYRERHRRFFAMPGWRELLAGRPCYATLDDHEVVNNWGSSPAHDSDEWAAVRDGALRAFVDYQGSRVYDVPERLPPSLHFSFCHGPVAVMVTDMRTPRSIARGTLFGEHQLTEIERFLRVHRDAPVAVVATSLPLFHIPKPMAYLGGLLTPDGDDFSDRAIHPAFEHEYRRICAILRSHVERHPEQQLVLVSGDIHLGAICAIEWPGGSKAAQLISSGVTRSPETGVALASSAAVQMSHLSPDRTGDVPSATVVETATDNPFLNRNMGLIEVVPDGAGGYAVELSLHGLRGGGDDGGRFGEAVRQRFGDRK